MKKSFRQLIIILMFLFIATSLSYGQNESIPYTLFKSGKYQEAIEESQKLIAQDKTNISAYAVMGWSYISLRRWKNALDISTEAEKIAPRDLRIIETKGEAYFQLKEDDKSLEYFSKYLVLAPNGLMRNWIYYYVGVIYKRQGKLYKADIALSTALTLDSDKVQWWLELAELYERQGRNEIAIDTYRTVLSINSSNAEAKKSLQRLNQR